MRPTPIRRMLAVLVAMTLLAAACAGDGEEATAAADCEVGQTDGDLNLYNWAEYIDPDLVDAFAAEHGVEMTVDVYDSNEAMQPIISAGNSGYDLIVPSDYMVAILIAGEDIQLLNKDAIPNIANISADFSDLVYDPAGDYSVPYQWGTTGVAVDTAVVGTELPEVLVDHFRCELCGSVCGPDLVAERSAGDAGRGVEVPRLLAQHHRLRGVGGG